MERSVKPQKKPLRTSRRIGRASPEGFLHIPERRAAAHRREIHLLCGGSAFYIRPVTVVSSAYITGMVSTHSVWEIIAIEAPVEVSPP